MSLGHTTVRFRPRPRGACAPLWAPVVRTARRATPRVVGLAVLLFSLSLGARWALARPAGVAQGVEVTFLEGRAEFAAASSVRKPGPPEADTAPAPGAGPRPTTWKALSQGMRLTAGQVVRTQAGGRLELKLADGSRIRLGAETMVAVDRIRVRKTSRAVRLDLWLGRLWAKVAHGWGDGRSFEVRTTNAVAGVRGTSFAVLAKQDLSAVIRVYAGSVGVTKGGYSRPKSVREVPGPRRVDQHQWEEVIAGAMTEVRVSAVGEIQPATDFLDEGEALEWAMWNQARDKTADL
ncbi:MAG: FecR domain-containing protein [Deltaproteobacteria bacterium]|nr:FecR domain-containing protein [Deltaproteobacteria bacterium]